MGSHIARAVGMLGALALLSSAPSTSRAQRVMDFDVSIRSTAMAGASGAVFWGDDLDHWANPALLGYARAIRYERGRTQLVPQLSGGIWITSEALKIGAPGAGVVLAGQPFLEGVHLDFGQSEGVDENGNPTGTFDVFERVESWGFGISAARLFEEAWSLAGREPPRWSRWADVSAGMNFKDIVIQHAPESRQGRASAHNQDWGALVRVTPVDRATASGITLRLDLAYAHSVLNSSDEAFHFPNETQPTVPSRNRRDGVAIHAALDPPGGGAVAGPGRWGWFLAGLSPLVALGTAYDRAHVTAGPGSGTLRASGWGVEATVANLAAIRIGHYDDDSDIEGGTSGFMVGLPVGRVAGFRYEEAHVPQPPVAGSNPLLRRAYSFWFDPLAAWSTLLRR